MENSGNKPKKRSILTLLGYGMGILLMLSSAGAFTSEEIGPAVGITYLMAGLSVFPPFWRFVKEKYNFNLSRPLRIATFIILLGISGGLMSKVADKVEKVEQPNVTAGQQQSAQQSNIDANSKPENEPQVKVEEKPVAIETFDIAVTSQIVKKVNGKCRYFFDIRNNDSKDFEGSVEITLMQSSGNKLGRETFNTKSSIKPTLGTSVYFDINTCPKELHGEYGITDFAYEVTVGKDQVAEGSGTITDKFENLDF